MAENQNSKLVKKSKVNQKIIDIAEEIQGIDAVVAGKLNFISLNFIQTILPHSKVEGEKYERENGAYYLSINALGKNRLIPYGTIPRMILSWIVTEAVRTDSRQVYIGNNLSQFMRNIGFDTGGNSMKRFKEQSLALFSSAIHISYDGEESMKAENIMIASKYEFWWDDENESQKSLFSSHVTLSADFFDLIKKYKVPVDLRAITALKQSSLAVDVYSWLTYRYNSLKRETRIPWEALIFQFGAGYKDDYQGRYKFKENFRIALKKISILYPEAKYLIENDGVVLFPSPTHIARKNNYFKKINE